MFETHENQRSERQRKTLVRRELNIYKLGLSMSRNQEKTTKKWKRETKAKQYWFETLENIKQPISFRWNSPDCLNWIFHLEEGRSSPAPFEIWVSRQQMRTHPMQSAILTFCARCLLGPSQEGIRSQRSTVGLSGILTHPPDVTALVYHTADQGTQKSFCEVDLLRCCISLPVCFLHLNSHLRDAVWVQVVKVVACCHCNLFSEMANYDRTHWRIPNSIVSGIIAMNISHILSYSTIP